VQHPESAPIQSAAAVRAAAWWPWLEVAAILALFALHGAWPGPTVNEPYYLGKAKHFWQPQWAAGDFFLGTADAHTVFYYTFGWLALWLPLPALAWTGRWITWSLLAWAWRRLSVAVVPARGAAVLSAGLWVFLIDSMNLAGEWVVGGVEAKGFAYVLVLLALEAVVRGRWNRAWLLLGAASAFHVLVGGWFAITLAMAWAVLRLADFRRSAVALQRPATPGLGAMLPSLVAACALALLGLWPSLALNRGLDAATIVEGNQWYVIRLWHHLDGWTVATLTPWFAVRFGLVTVAWIVVVALWKVCLDAAATPLQGVPPGTRPSTGALQPLVWTIHATLVVAAVGMGLSALRPAYPDVAEALLRFYWFRTSDVAVPLGVALLGTLLVFRGLAALRPYAWLGLAALTAAVALQAADDLRLRLDGTPQFEEDFVDEWNAACQWLNASSIPRDAKFITPRLAQTFKWLTGRPEIVTWKEIPQNAAAIVEWGDRLDKLFLGDVTPGSSGWWHCLAERDPADLRRLAALYDAEYLFTYSMPKLPFKVMYRNEIYTIYRMPPPAGAR